MTRDELKRRVFAAIDRRAEEIIGLGERIRKQPEMGFKEVKTAGLVRRRSTGSDCRPGPGSR
jgi:metal-dependent amidase/aminoacylase/carboxypeptidase family protein